MPRSLTGIRPSGDMHIGNYLGAIKPGIELQKTHECFYFIADMHALTTNKNPKLVEQVTYDVISTWLACGLDVSRSIMYRQSDVSFVAELAWYLSCVTGFGFLEKGHAFKDVVAQEKEVNHGVFAYPVLMAADIVMYDADIVPVGKDQKQHVEMARDIAGSLNAVYGQDLLKLPTPYVIESTMLVPGLDGRKMSKSYNNVIPLFAAEKELKKSVMSIVTDSTPIEAPKSMKGILLGELFNILASKDKVAEVEKKLQAGGYGWGHAKEELFFCTNDLIKDMRAKYIEIRKDEGALTKILDEGRRRAFDAALPVLNRVRKAVGMRSFGYIPVG